MRILGLALVLLGLLGVALGLLHALIPSLNLGGVDFSAATVPGIGPILAGVILLVLGLVLPRFVR